VSALTGVIVLLTQQLADLYFVYLAVIAVF